MIISFDGFDEIEVLKEIYYHTQPAGVGLIFEGCEPITDEECYTTLEGDLFVDYLFGRPIKVDFSTFPLIDDTLFSSYYEEGRMETVLLSLLFRKMK